MRSARPPGFVFLTVCALACAVMMAAVLDLDGKPPAVRFAVGATGALALVVAEALACVRPWAFGASVAFAGTFIAMLITVSIPDTGAVVGLVSVAMLFIVVALSIVHHGMNPAPAVPGMRRRYPRAP